MTDEMVERCREFLSRIPDDLNYILPGDLAAALDRDPESVFVLDNRTPRAFAEGHIPGAVNIWIKDALQPENLAKLPRDKRIVVCCWVGHTASQLLAVLRLLGYDAVGLKYGMGTPANPAEAKAGWAELGLPVEGGQTRGDGSSAPPVGSQRP
jgi:rhodanese-related sulfurtransferase